MKRILIGSIICLTFLFMLKSMENNHIPLSVLFESPEIARVTISPNGSHIAYLKPDTRHKLQVWVAPIDNPTKATQITQDTQRSILNYMWQHDNQHILYLQDNDGNENWNIFQTNIATKKTNNLTPFTSVKVQVISYKKEHPHTLVISMNHENKEIHDLYTLDLLTHQVTLLEKGDQNTLSWIVDSNLQPAFTEQTQEDGSKILLHKSNGSWKTFLHWSFEDFDTSEPLFMTKDNQYLYVLDSTNKDLNQLIKINIATKHQQVIAQDDTYELSSTVITNPDTYEIQAIECEKEKSEWIIVDQAIADHMNAISELHYGVFHITSKAHDNSKWLVAFDQDTGPLAYFVYDTTNKQSTFLFHNRPKLLNYKLQQMHPISLTAQDGLPLHGYVTLPEQTAQSEPAPIVVLVHGGPWSRDSWGQGHYMQWLANRGYACLQINYRGSTGYGKALTNAGNKEWGNKALTDLVDGVNWLAEHYNVDKKRVAIMGASHGGYAALAAAAFTQGVFSCAVDLFGRSNLIGRFTGIPPYWKRYIAIFKKRFGDPETEKALFDASAPLLHADKINIPLFIAHGAKDARIPQSESDKIAQALQKNNVPCEYVVFENEGHGFINQENRFSCYQQIEDFLKKYI